MLSWTRVDMCGTADVKEAGFFLPVDVVLHEADSYVFTCLCSGI